MRSPIDIVWDLSYGFMSFPRYVNINNDKIAETALSLKNVVDNQPYELLGYPNCIKDDSDFGKLRKLVLYELIANSVNYCYWYGVYDIRPYGASAVKMYRLLDESFEYVENKRFSSTLSWKQYVESVVDRFVGFLVEHRFSIVDERIRHLREIVEELILPCFIYEDVGFDRSLSLVLSISGYSKDLFLKRIILFFMQLYRRIGLFPDRVAALPIPADYQIPKMLRHFGCIEYTPFLANLVDNQLLIPESSQIECEIRAASIVACKKLADLAGCHSSDVDWYLWSRRKECGDPFHLTITTNY